MGVSCIQSTGAVDPVMEYALAISAYPIGAKGAVGPLSSEIDV